MRDFFINIDDIKNFICKTSKKNYIKSKRILGITMRYTNGKQYRSLYSMLKYIKPYINDNVEQLVNVFENKIRQKHVSAKEYEKHLRILQEYLDKINPENLPPLSEQFRQIQLKTLNLAKEIVEDIERNTDIKMWFGGGSLLGAVRHKGFIPWDDDIDFDMMRPDFEKVKEYLSKKYTLIDTSNFEIKTFTEDIRNILKTHQNEIIVLPLYDVFKIVRGTPEDFYSVDFFAWDYYCDFHNTETLQRYKETINEQAQKIKYNKELFAFYQQEISKNKDIVKESDCIAPGIDNHAFKSYTVKEIVRKSDIFPLKKMKFEDWEFNSPANPHIYLKSLYNFYNKIPSENLAIACHANTSQMEV